ncbi:MAG: hypothetical protein NW206_15260 [Hyphomonadaceae bacterium]|nr:hypothetical protein [Hyphomonadaceae bacterium]
MFAPARVERMKPASGYHFERKRQNRGASTQMRMWAPAVARMRRARGELQDEMHHAAGAFVEP